ncbi:hypothetical protein EIP86_008995 [Pleurotus ostreatoroseus]|nr:hypothetical protein EIP86_008995 [Pleurotus ostreatoroseus]
MTPEYIDLYLIHSPISGKQKRLDTWRALIEKRNSGKVRSIGRPIVEYCRKNNIIVQAYCPLIRGDFHNPLFVELAKKYNKSIPQILIRWSLQHGFSPLPKSSRVDRIRENAEVYDFAISEADMAQIDALDKGDDGACQWNPIHSE